MIVRFRPSFFYVCVGSNWFWRHHLILNQLPQSSVKDFCFLFFTFLNGVFLVPYRLKNRDESRFSSQKQSGPSSIVSKIPYPRDVSYVPWWRIGETKGPSQTKLGFQRRSVREKWSQPVIDKESRNGTALKQEICGRAFHTSAGSISLRDCKDTRR